MIILRLFFFFLLLIFYPDTSGAQNDNPCPEPENKKAVKLFQQGVDKKKYDIKERQKFLTEATELEPEYGAAIFELAWLNIKVAKSNQSSYKSQEPALLKAISLCPEYNPIAYFYLANIYYSTEKYKDAMKQLKDFMKRAEGPKFAGDYERAEEMYENAEFNVRIFDNPVPFSPVALNNISTSNDEYLAILSPDNEQMFFTRKTMENSRDFAWDVQTPKETFTVSKRINSEFTQGEPLPQPFNRSNNNGGATITIDSKTMYFTICAPDAAKYLNCDIYTSTWDGFLWSEPVNLGPNVNLKNSFDAQPTISSDGKTLIFASYREGGFGGIDIYKSEKDATGVWSKAINLGPVVNTAGNEKTPFIHSDSQTLYFSSDGHKGVGGFDIFLTRKNDAGIWLKPVNIGFPINSREDEHGFFASLDGNYGYFASNKINKKGNLDIYSFELHKEAQPEKVLFVKGKLDEPVEGNHAKTKLELKNISTKEITEVEVDSTTGEYAAVVTLKKPDNFMFTVKKEDYAFSSKLITPMDSIIRKPVKIDLEFKPLEVGEAYTINDITYKTNSAGITEESKLVIDELVNYLVENPKIKIGIQGHTDNIGDEKKNLALSSDRAFSVYEYIVDKGIDSKRITFKGFGETKPIDSNDNERGRMKNRRTEFIILEK